MNKIIDNNLKLELINDSHAEELFKLTDMNREYLRKWLMWVDVTISVKDTEAYIQRSKLQNAENDGFQCIIKYDNKIAGMIGLVYIRNASRKTEIGYWLSEELQGKGIITRCCRSVIDHCFYTLNLNKIIIQCASENEASQGVPKRLNFKMEGLLRQDGFLNGKFVDHIRYAMLKEEWDKNNYIITEKKCSGCHDSQADTYDKRIITDVNNPNDYIRENYFKVHKEVIRMANLKDGETILDIGIGTGLLEERINNNVRIFGIDISQKMMDKIKEKKIKPAGLKLGSFNVIPFEEKTFDAVLSCYAFHHLTDIEKEKSIYEMKRVLKKNGRIIIGDFMYFNEKIKQQLLKKFHSESRADMIEEMEEENFTNVETFKQRLEEYGFEVESNQVSTISWVMRASLN